MDSSSSTKDTGRMLWYVIRLTCSAVEGSVNARVARWFCCCLCLDDTLWERSLPFPTFTNVFSSLTTQDIADAASISSSFSLHVCVHVWTKHSSVWRWWVSANEDSNFFIVIVWCSYIDWCRRIYLLTGCAVSRGTRSSGYIRKKSFVWIPTKQSELAELVQFVVWFRLIAIFLSGMSGMFELIWRVLLLFDEPKCLLRIDAYVRIRSAVVMNVFFQVLR